MRVWGPTRLVPENFYPCTFYVASASPQPTLLQRRYACVCVRSSACAQLHHGIGDCTALKAACTIASVQSILWYQAMCACINSLFWWSRELAGASHQESETSEHGLLVVSGRGSRACRKHSRLCCAGSGRRDRRRDRKCRVHA